MRLSPEKLKATPIEKFKPVLEEESIIDINPEEKKSDMSVLVAPGWGKMVSQVKENLLQVLADDGGRRVLATDYPREMRLDTANLPEEVPAQELQKAAALLELLEEKEIKKTDAIGHSEGGLYLPIAAVLEPEKFRNLVLVNPAGMIGQDSLLGLAYRFMIKEGSKSTLPKAAEKGERVKAFLDYAIKHPVMSLKEVKQISQADIYDLLKFLKEQGIHIAVVATNSDDVFTMERIQEQYHKEKEAGTIKDYTEIFDGFYSTLGTHGEAIGHGEELEPQQLPRALVHILEVLEKKSETGLEK